MDLMIGNQILHDGNEIQVTGISPRCIYWEDDECRIDCISSKRFTPIPVTDRRLTELEFKRHPWGWIKNGVVINQSKDDFWIEIWNVLRINVSHIHKLQNFFTLAGIELKLKS